MADINLVTANGVTFTNRQNKRAEFLIEKVIDFADAASTKGSAIVATDIIKGIKIPAGTFIHSAGIQKTAALTGTVSVATLDVGVTANGDGYVDGYDVYAGAVNSFGTPAGTDNNLLVTSDTTLDVTVATLTGTLTGGKVRIWAIVTDVRNDHDQPGIVQLKS